MKLAIPASNGRGLQHRLPESQARHRQLYFQKEMHYASPPDAFGKDAQYIMISHTLPANEVERLAALRRLLLLDTPPEKRFFDNPFFIGALHIRFNAGAPLELQGGQRLGTLCLIDTAPRTLDALDLAILGSLRDLVVSELEAQ